MDRELQMQRRSCVDVDADSCLSHQLPKSLRVPSFIWWKHIMDCIIQYVCTRGSFNVYQDFHSSISTNQHQHHHHTHFWYLYRQDLANTVGGKSLYTVHIGVNT